jgi:U3 small nucleolar RNA-associated protein 20
VAEQLPWRPYHDLLQTLLRKLKREPLLERRLVRAMVSTIEGFHFDLTAADAEYASGAAEGRALALKAAGGGGGAAAGAGPSAVEDGPGAAAEAMEVEGQAAEGGADDTAGGVDNEDTAGGAHDEDTAGGADDGDTACGEDDTGGGDDDVLLGAEDAAAALAADADAAAAATALVDANVARARACAILATVRDRLLPPLYAHMRDPKTDGARVAVAVAVLKLLKLLPPRALAGQLKPFLMRLVATLGSRDKGVRARGREALGMVVVELGPGHFRAVVHELETSLKRGFQLQVSASLRFAAPLNPVLPGARAPNALPARSAPVARTRFQLLTPRYAMIRTARACMCTHTPTQVSPGYGRIGFIAEHVPHQHLRPLHPSSSSGSPLPA